MGGAAAGGCWTPTSSGCRSSGTPKRWSWCSSDEALEGKYDLLAEPATGGRIICAALVRKGLLRGIPTWVSDFPDAVRLQSTDPMDVQAPEIELAIPGFSRPVLNFQVALREAPPLTEVFVTHLKSKLPTRIDAETGSTPTRTPTRRTRSRSASAISTIRRTAEAAALRVLLTSVMKGTQTPVLVLGDVNDGQHSNTLNILTEQPRYLVGESGAASTSASTRRRRCRSTATPATSTTPTCIRTCASRWTTSWSASSSTTTAAGGCGCSTG